MTLKKDLIVVLTDVEKELALREQFKALGIVSEFKNRFVADLVKENSNPEYPLHAVIFNIIMLLESK